MLDKNFWKKYFSDYDLLNNLIPYDDLLESICNKAEIKTGDLVLDAGSGTGNLSLKIASFGGKIVGIDYSEEGIRLHKQKQQNAELILHNLTEPLPFVDNTFDVIVSNNVLYTISRAQRLPIFKEFHRVLKTGGIIVIANLAEHFNSFVIFRDHLKRYRKKFGLLKTLYHIFSLLLPTVRIFYYNYLIKSENKTGSYDFFSKDEQKEYLKKSGFSIVTDTEMHYSGQSVLNKAIK